MGESTAGKCERGSVVQEHERGEGGRERKRGKKRSTEKGKRERTAVPPNGHRDRRKHTQVKRKGKERKGENFSIKLDPIQRPPQ